MILKAFRILFLIGFSLNLCAQTRLEGTVLEAFTGKKLPAVNVNLGEQNTLSDSSGKFSLLISGTDTKRINFSKENYESKTVDLKPSQKTIIIRLTNSNYGLNEISVSGKRRKDFGFLGDVKGTAIYAGKKTEFIKIDNVIANLSTNNAREIYAKVAGLNIWESESGLQLNVGGRGLDPNRASNFNVRQNGHDISPDALGYPESYYTPPVEAVDAIEIIRGAASLQYGTQFGGMINFNMKTPVRDKKLQIISRQSAGSYGLFNTFNSISGTSGKVGYYAYANYKQGAGFRPNSDYRNFSGYAHLDYRIDSTATVGIQFTHLNYLAQQAGGLDDAMFEQDPAFSNRSRNWFGIDWNLLNIFLDKEIGSRGKLNIRAFGLLASRDALGFQNYRPSVADDNSNRDYIRGRFKNAGIEARYLHSYNLLGLKSVGLIGSRTYSVSNTGRQGLANNGVEADFAFISHPENLKSDYKYPNFNQAFFLENIIYLTDKFTLTPGIRYEYINTRAKGSYRDIVKDLPGNIILNEISRSNSKNRRSFIIGGLGAEYKQNNGTGFYGNLSQNFRAITFSDIHITSPSFVIDTNIRDEKGFSLDAGIRNQNRPRFKYDISAFLLNYDNRIGETRFIDPITQREKSKRTNLGQALIYGLESYLWAKIYQPGILRSLIPGIAVFSNLSFIRSEYIKSELPNIKGNQVEFIPDINIKGGVEFLWNRLGAKLQATYLSEQFTDATNDENGGAAAITGIIPAFKVFDFGAVYTWKYLKFEAGVNNFTNEYYFTRRATGYPGPGIIPSQNRSYYVAVQLRLQDFSN